MNNVSNLPQISPSYQKRRAVERGRATAAANAVSPSKIRHRLFADEASKLGPGEHLEYCPRCTSPARVMNFRASCTRVSCEFAFCTRCMCEAHADGDSGDCLANEAGVRASRRKQVGKVASKKSKSRLKRL